MATMSKTKEWTRVTQKTIDEQTAEREHIPKSKIST